MMSPNPPASRKRTTPDGRPRVSDTEPAPPASVNPVRVTAPRSASTAVAPPRSSTDQGSAALRTRSLVSRFQWAEALSHWSPTRARQSNQAKRG